MRLRHRVHCAASPEQVWRLLGQPASWPRFAVLLLRVRGAHGPAAAGQHLMAVARGVAVQIPIDVLDVDVERRLAVRIHAVPGVAAELTYQLAPAVRGGCDITVCVVVEGLFARGAVLPSWLSAAGSARLLAFRAERLARHSGKAAEGAA